MDKWHIVIPVALATAVGGISGCRETHMSPDVSENKELGAEVDLKGSRGDLYNRALSREREIYSQRSRIKSKQSDEWVDVKDTTLEAIALYNAVIEKAPESREAEEARERLGGLYLDAFLQEAPTGSYIQLGDIANLHLLERKKKDVTDRGDRRNFVSYLVQYPNGRMVVYKDIQIEGPGNDYSFSGNPKRGLRSLVSR